MKWVSMFSLTLIFVLAGLSVWSGRHLISLEQKTIRKIPRYVPSSNIIASLFLGNKILGSDIMFIRAITGDKSLTRYERQSLANRAIDLDPKHCHIYEIVATLSNDSKRIYEILQRSESFCSENRLLSGLLARYYLLFNKFERSMQTFARIKDLEDSEKEFLFVVLSQRDSTLISKQFLQKAIDDTQNSELKQKLKQYFSQILKNRGASDAS